MEQTARLYGDIERILLTKDQIAAAVKDVATRITKDFADKPPVCIGILKGAIVFFADLIREIDLPLSTEFMAISSYANQTKSTGVVRILKDLDRDITGEHVLIIEDIVDSGRTLSYLKEVFKTRNAASVSIVTLLDKPSRRTTPLEVRYSCFNIPDAFVVGYGLDFAEKYRNLPDIGVLKREIYEREGC